MRYALCVPLKYPMHESSFWYKRYLTLTLLQRIHKARGPLTEHDVGGVHDLIRPQGKQFLELFLHSVTLDTNSPLGGLRSIANSVCLVGQQGNHGSRATSTNLLSSPMVSRKSS